MKNGQCEENLEVFMLMFTDREIEVVNSLHSDAIREDVAKNGWLLTNLLTLI